MIQPKDCTKEELVWYIEKRLFYRKDEFEQDILFHRTDVIAEKQHVYSGKAIEALSEYIEIMKPYQGKKIIDIPSEAFRKAKQYIETHDKYEKMAEKLEKEYEKCNKKIDQVLRNYR